MATIAALGIGSGLDLNGLLSQLEAAERQRLQPLVQQKGSYQARISAFGKLEGALSSLQASLASLGKEESFAAVSSTVAGDGVKAAATSKAVPGSYSVTVNTLAQAYSSATLGIDDKTRDLGAGSVSFTLGDGTQHDIAIDEAESSLESIRDAINAQQGDVVASIINDGDANQPYRLALTAAKTGTDAEVTTLTFTGMGDELQVDVSSVQAAQNASLSINGVDVTSQSNQVAEAIQGVTLTLDKAGETATVTVNRDQAAVQKTVESFVSSYNKLQSTMRELSAYNAETQSAGLLLGDSSLRTVESRLRSIFSEPIGGDGFNSLSELGITRELDGSLSIDDERLAEITDTELTALKEFFVGTDTVEGFTQKATDTVDLLLDSEGPIAVSTEGMKSAIERLDERYAREEISIAQTIERYRVQFGQLDSIIANMNATSSYLTQQFDALSAQLNQKK